MQLNQVLRSAFIKAVMDDVPKIDYHEQIQKAAQEAFCAVAPKSVQAAWAKNESRPYVKTATFSLCQDLSSVAVPYFGAHYIHASSLEELRPSDKEKLLSLKKLALAQLASRRDLRNKLESVVAGCRTTNQLIKALPEFEKYLPKEPSAVAHLPALANVVSDFVKAGWPKQAENQAQLA